MPRSFTSVAASITLVMAARKSDVARLMRFTPASVSSFTVKDLPRMPAMKLTGFVTAALRGLFAREGIEDDVAVRGENGAVVARTPYPLIISRMYQWRGPFEDAIRSAVHTVAPDAVVAIEWDYPDGE